MAEEGICKFNLQFSTAAPVMPDTRLCELTAWRSILWKLGLIGQNPQRYGGHGFGNVSQRIAPAGTAVHRRAFLISGTQTGAQENLDATHYSHVLQYDTSTNRVTAEGPVEPSSESLTHGMIYDLDDRIRTILHVHSPEIWEHAKRLGIPVTDQQVAYGTPEMAREVERLFTEYDFRQEGILSMGGHKDGIVAFGTSAKVAGCILLTTLAASFAMAG